MTFTPDTIYRDLMRSVHPDLHPEMKEATVRAQQVNGYKNNKQALRMLAVMWGLVTPTASDTRIDPNMFRNTYTRTTYTRPVRPTRPNVIRDLSDLGLFMNRNYRNMNINVRIRTRGYERVCKVIRTTKKCVVVDFHGYEKVVRMSNVVRKEG